MGNIGSQLGNSAHKYKLEASSPPPVADASQLSLPRVNQSQHQQQQKVLPVSKEPPPKLRPTENGKILHSGGTLSGRHQEKISRGNFMNAKEKVKYLREIQEDKSLHQRVHHHQKELTKKFGSEPDLRYHIRAEKTNVKPKRYTAAKKLIQTASSLEKRSRELENFCENIESFSMKRAGLFRTRAESRKQKLISKSVPQASEKVWEDNRQPVPQNELTTNKDNILKRFDNDLTDLESAKVDESDKKKYYFGMENNIESLEYQLNYEIENYEVTKLSDEMRSNLSNNLRDEEDDQTISLYLRPILPKKQLEMPKFSSSLAWKLLYLADFDSNLDGDSTTKSEDDPSFLEDKIEKALPISPHRLLPNKSLDFQFSQDKSGDSGISGDETPKPTLAHYKSKQSWTPQQDLGDDSSTDDEVRFNSVPCYSTNTNRPHIFSLSLPRDHMEWHKTQAHIQSEAATDHLKRSASGAFGNHGTAIDDPTVSDVQYETCNFNWLLSKSAPNSLNNGFNSLESAYVYNEALTSLVPLNGHQNAKGRIIYLPDNDVIGEGLRSNKKRIARDNSVCRNDDMKNDTPGDFVQEAERRERERLKEIETMQRIEEEFRRKRSRYNNLYSNTRHNFRKVLLSVGEKSV